MFFPRVTCQYLKARRLDHTKISTFNTSASRMKHTAEQFWHRHDAETKTLILGVKECWINEKIEGDIDKISISPDSSSLTIDYSGLSYSEADELYHSVWSNTEGNVELSLESLVPPKVVLESLIEVNPSVLQSPFELDEETWIFRIKTK